MAKTDFGDGPPCPEDGNHGKTYVMGDYLWCPVTQALWGEARYDEDTKTFVVGASVRVGQRKMVQRLAATLPAIFAESDEQLAGEE